MRVTFLLPFINHRGGSQLVMEVSDRLAGCGDDVTVVWPTRLRQLPGPLNEIEYLWRAPWKTLTSRWYRTRARVVAVPSLAQRYIPRADVVVATAWQTARFAAGYGPDRGRKVYWIFEPETHHDPEGCVSTYRLPFDVRITISGWTSDELASRYGERVDGVTPLGLDLALYPPRTAPPRDTVAAIGMVYDPSAKKGFADGFAAVEELRRDHPGVRLHLIGVPRRPPQFPPWVATHFRAPHDEKVAVFHACDVWLASSHQEGWGLAPHEAMACGCAVVSTRVGGTPYFAVDGETALVVDPGDRAGLARALRRLVDDLPLRQRLVRQGLVKARERTIDETARQFRLLVSPRER